LNKYGIKTDWKAYLQREKKRYNLVKSFGYLFFVVPAVGIASGYIGFKWLILPHIDMHFRLPDFDNKI